MSDELKILLKRPRGKCKFDWDDPEEAATHGLLIIKTPSHILTHGFNKRIGASREGPLVSAYPVAEWFAWNWWRLTSEIRERPANGLAARQWDFSHRLSTIGSGYDWPNISIYSDGCKSYLESVESGPDSVRSFLYKASSRERVSTRALEDAMSKFIDTTITQLEDSGIQDSNLQRLWSDLKSEQANPDDARYRAMEARLGFDPDDLNEEIILGILDSAEQIGRDALDEVAADAARGVNPADNFPSTETFQIASDKFGVDASLDSMVTLSGESSDRFNSIWKYGEAKAGQIGKELAEKLRSQEQLGEQNISNNKLAQFAGLNESFIVNSTTHWEKMSFYFQNDNEVSKLTLRPKWETGRRFELARLIGDRVAREFWELPIERLSPATSAKSYRQKLQRAFAAELLCPIENINEIIGNDYSHAKQKKAAEAFNVSEHLVFWQLWRHGRISEPSIL